MQYIKLFWLGLPEEKAKTVCNLGFLTGSMVSLNLWIYIHSRYANMKKTDVFFYMNLSGSKVEKWYGIILKVNAKYCNNF